MEQKKNATTKNARYGQPLKRRTRNTGRRGETVDLEACTFVLHTKQQDTHTQKESNNNSTVLTVSNKVKRERERRERDNPIEFRGLVCDIITPGFQYIQRDTR